MCNLTKKLVLFVAAAAFLLASSNVFLLAHLAEHKSESHHDGDKCPICQQAVINKGKVIVLPDAVVSQPVQITIANVNAVKHFVKSFKFITPYLRAPPVAA
jgi:hypothetical protein